MENRKLKSLSNIIILFLTISGIGLAFFIFLLLSNNDNRNSLSWLNLFVVIWLFSINGILILVVKNSLKRANKILPSLLTSVTFITVYDVVAVIIVIIAAILNIFVDRSLYRIFLSAHLISGFVLIVAMSIAFLSTKRVAQVADKEEALTSNLDSLKSNINMVAVKVNGLDSEFQTIKDNYRILQEKVRYISPNKSSDAISLESRIVEGLKLIEHDLKTVTTETCNDVVKQIKEITEFAIMRDKVVN